MTPPPAIFNYTAANFMTNKQYKVYNLNELTLVKISSPFLGNWEFKISSISFEDILKGLKLYMSGELIQDCFPSLTPSERECFITSPRMWLHD